MPFWGALPFAGHSTWVGVRERERERVLRSNEISDSTLVAAVCAELCAPWPVHSMVLTDNEEILGGSPSRCAWHLPGGLLGECGISSARVLNCCVLPSLLFLFSSSPSSSSSSSSSLATTLTIVVPSRLNHPRDCTSCSIEGRLSLEAVHRHPI